MPTAVDFVPVSYQASIFTPEADFVSSKIVGRLLPNWLERFNGEPMMLPLPSGAPRELPRIQLQSVSGNWRCDIAPARMNVFWGSKAEDRGPLGLADFFLQAGTLLIEYAQFVDSPANRLAAVLNRYALTDAPARILASHFCKERWLAAPLNRPENFELHAHKTFLLANQFQVNSWVRNKSGLLTDPSGQRPIIVVEQDINTLAEPGEGITYSAEGISGFFKAVVGGFEEILGLYYPTKETQ